MGFNDTPPQMCYTVRILLRKEDKLFSEKYPELADAFAGLFEINPDEQLQNIIVY